MKEFPKDLKTPVDKAYLQKIMRRARQSKHKRKQGLQDEQKAKVKEEDSAPMENGENKRKAAELPKKVNVSVPELETEFPTKIFNRDDFS